MNAYFGCWMISWNFFNKYYFDQESDLIKTRKEIDCPVKEKRKHREKCKFHSLELIWQSSIQPSYKNANQRLGSHI
jgi:hypothetical protein